MNALCTPIPHLLLIACWNAERATTKRFRDSLKRSTPSALVFHSWHPVIWLYSLLSHSHPQYLHTLAISCTGLYTEVSVIIFCTCTALIWNLKATGSISLSGSIAFGAQLEIARSIIAASLLTRPFCYVDITMGYYIFATVQDSYCIQLRDCVIQLFHYLEHSRIHYSVIATCYCFWQSVITPIVPILNRYQVWTRPVFESLKYHKFRFNVIKKEGSMYCPSFCPDYEKSGLHVSI